MKLFETHFEEYIKEVTRFNLHKDLEKIYYKFPDSIENLNNIIFYGPSGVGKYSQMLYSIQKYSPTKLRYEKKMCINYLDKSQYFLKISDIHYEVDMSLLGCNAKTLWNCIYYQIMDSITTKQIKKTHIRKILAFITKFPVSKLNGKIIKRSKSILNE